jgi:futalosine hydrolase
VATTYALAKALSAGDTFHFALQAGIGGAFDRQIAPGDVVFITADEFADLGAEDHDQYLDIYQMGLAGKDDFPFADGRLYTPLAAVHQSIALPQVSALTVNMVTGNEASVARLMAKYGAAVESMEGAAFHYVCLQENIPFAQVRAISNFVEPRDKSKWKMKEAVIGLNKWLISYFQQKVINI